MLLIFLLSLGRPGFTNAVLRRSFLAQINIEGTLWDFGGHREMFEVLQTDSRLKANV